MSDFNWCHGPSCHTNQTVDRIRGTKGNKVLRTRKVPQTPWNAKSFLKYFCSQGCAHLFIQEHIDEFIALHPRAEALETPISDPVKVKHRSDYSWGTSEWTTTEFKPLDNA